MLSIWRLNVQGFLFSWYYFPYKKELLLLSNVFCFAMKYVKGFVCKCQTYSYSNVLYIFRVWGCCACTCNGTGVSPTVHLFLVSFPIPELLIDINYRKAYHVPSRFITVAAINPNLFFTNNMYCTRA